MKAIVCVKQVPDTQGKVAVKADGTMDRSAMATITNPDDLNAVEAALQLKDETGCEVVVVTMGPPPAEGMLRELMARGADRGVLVSGREFEDGYMELKVQTPCLLTCIKELNTPRYMSVSGIFECYDKPLEVFDYNALKDDPLIETDTIGLKGSPTNVYKSFAPPVKGAGMKVEDAAQLVGILNDKHLI